jgi:hypothetical protein
MQTALALLIVAACAAYVAWTLGRSWFGYSPGCGCDSCPAKEPESASKK